MIKTEDIIKALRDCGGGPEGINICRNAADRLKQLQAELEIVRENFKEAVAREATLAERANSLLQKLDEVKAERDALHIYYKDLINKPDCNDCKAEDCQYRPQWGEVVRVNCPLWRGVRKEEPNAE